MFLQLILVPLLLTFNSNSIANADMDHTHMNHHNHEDMTGSMESMHSMHSMHGMDMNGTGMDMMDMMKSYFHTTLGDTLLFKSWVLDSSSRTIVACIVFFLMALLYEGLKSYREFLFTRVASKRCYSVSVINTGSNGCPENCGDGKPPARNVVTCRMWSWAHFYQSLLHVLQVIASYTLMLGFMSYNIWICLAIALGAGHGYFLFCWKRITVVDVTEHCN